jgi:fructokinase
MTRTPQTVVAFGEVLYDILPDGPVLGGALFNFASRINEFGETGILISRIGEDELGRKILARMEDLKLEKTYLQVDEAHPTGTVKVMLDDERNPDYEIIEKVAYDYINLTKAQEDVVARADCFCFGSLIQRHEVSRNTLHELFSCFGGRYMLYDINLRKDSYTREIIDTSLDHANVLKLNIDELQELRLMYNINTSHPADIASAMLNRFNLKLCILTMGHEGVFVASSTGEKLYVPAYKVKVVEPIGAGDAFTAAFMSKLLQNKPLIECSKFGNMIGAIVAGQRGATQPIDDETFQLFEKGAEYATINAQFSDYLVN